LVYNLSGDTLLAQKNMRHTKIESVLLNSSEDHLIIAKNEQYKDKTYHGNITIFKLFSLGRGYNFTSFCYSDVLKLFNKDFKRIPMIRAIALERGEESMNLLFESEET